MTDGITMEQATIKKLPAGFKKTLYNPFNSETGRIAGLKGGAVKSERKKLAASIRFTKHGRYSKNMMVLRAITPTPVERAVGITLEDKLAIVKKIAPSLATPNIAEALLHYTLNLVDIKTEMLKVEKLLEQTAKTDTEKIIAAKMMIALKDRYAEKEWEFLRDVFGIGKPGFEFKSVTASTETSEKITLNKMMQEVLGEIRQ